MIIGKNPFCCFKIAKKTFKKNIPKGNIQIKLLLFLVFRDLSMFIFLNAFKKMNAYENNNLKN